MNDPSRRAAEGSAVTREELGWLVDIERSVSDELEIVPAPRAAETADVVDAREEADAAGDATAHGERLSPEMIGLPAPSADLLPRRRRFLLRTRPAGTEPHADPAREHPVDGVPEPAMRGTTGIVVCPPAPAADRPDLAGFRLPGTRVPRPAPHPAPVAEPVTAASPRVADDDAVPTRPDRQTRRRARRARAVVMSCVVSALLMVAIGASVLALVAR